MTKIAWIILFACMCAGLQTEVFAQPATDKKLPVAPQVKIGKLANGLTYYIRKNAEPENRAELRLVVNAGSILENDNQRGLAHFVEHMAFNGTKNFQKQELVDFLEKSGVSFGADLNAYTSFDETVYELQVPTDSPAVFKKAMQILEDWAHNVSFDHKEIDKERGVVIEEWRLGLGAEERMREKYFPVILKGSKYADRLPIGTKQNLETFKYETLKQFYRDWYRPDLQAVIVVGDIDVDSTEQLIREHFSRIPKRTNAKPRTKFNVPAQKGTATAVITDPEQPYNIVQVFYKQQAIPEAQTEREYRATLVRSMFNQMMSNRLQELAQKPDAPFLFGNSSYSNFIADKDALVLFAVAKDGLSIPGATRALLQENERVRQHGFTATELARAKTAMLSNMETMYNERDKTKSAHLVQELIRNFLKKETIPGIEYEYQMYQRFVPGIELKEVNSLVAKWLKPDDRAVLVLAPDSEKKNLVKKEQLVALLNKPFGKLQPYKDVTVTGSILANAPMPGKITSRKEVKELGVTELTLSNGARVILKPTNFKNNEILISAISPGGISLYNDEVYLSAANASGIVQLGGLGNYDVMSLQKELTGKQAYVSPSISQYSEGLSGSAIPKDLETAFMLLNGYFTEPRKDSSMFQVMLQQLSSSLANKGKDPNAVFADSVNYILGNYHYRRQPLTLQRLQEIELEKAFTIYKERFADAGDFIFTFVGNFSVDSITPLVEKYIAGLPSKNINEQWKDVGIRYPSGNIQKVIRKGQESRSTVRIAFTGTSTYSDLEATQLSQLAKVLAIRLREELREEQGGVYGVNVNAALGRVPTSSYIISISFSTSPGNVDKLTAIVMQEIEKLKQEGASQTNIEKVIAEDVRSLQLQVKENSYWLYNLEQKYYHNEDPRGILQDPAMVKQLTVQRTKELANQYFDMKNMIKLVLAPEEK
ncbi:M16 family metallopeptidase [Aridibaculum aurantiacum]|uniref:M16 family metallopeptidase n=1 Tax=Aridibaculum aurantiacum TaxID=2810307 RepID=UPI001A964E68|nr:insulinase family protein [Aridibaculum aurantiacum]